jgi:flagellar motility protein MotE (MotC chaperone)
MKGLRTFVAAVVLLNLLVGMGLVGYLLATGRLDATKAAAIVDLLRRPGSPPNLRSGVADLLAPPATTATSAPAAEATTVPQALPGASAGIASATDRIAYAQRAIEQERLRLDRQAQDLQNRQKLLDAEGRQLDTRVAQLETDRKKLEEQLAANGKQVHDANFTRMLELYSELKPAQVKSLFMAMDSDLVASYLQAMDVDQAARIVAEFQSDEEKSFILVVLDKLRTSGTASALAGAATQPNPPASTGQARN